MSVPREFVLTLSCRDAKGIVYAVSGLLYQAGCNIVDSQQFGDVQSADSTGLFFMRVHFEAPTHLTVPGMLEQLFTHVREQFQMDAHFYSLAQRPRRGPWQASGHASRPYRRTPAATPRPHRR